MKTFWPHGGLVLATASLLLLALTAPPLLAAPRLQVSPDHHHLVKADGAPFFYLGDTAWELFHRLNREEADEYLRNRSAKGFTVIQAVVLAEFDGLTVPNPYGQLPLVNNDPAKPNEAYFQHVDYIVNKAEEQGMYIGMLPTWGDKWNQKWGVGPEVFTPGNAKIFGEFLGRRYKEKPIIWILGGDRSPENDRHLAIVRALAAGLKAGDGGNHLLTYHPSGNRNSAQWFHNDDWLDFEMCQSGHSAYNIPNYQYALKNWQLMPPKPTLDGEPRYEDHPVNWHRNGNTNWFGDYDVRQAAYWSMLAGACGHTYGNHDIWQFWQPGRQPISFARTPWRQAMDQPGAFQMKYLRELFESLPWQRLVADPSVLAGDAGEGADYAQAARASDGSCLLVYVPTGKAVTVKFDRLNAQKVRASWYDPRIGKAVVAGQFDNQGTHQLEPFSRGRGNDWLLILDDPAQGFPIPGLPRKK